ncbi:UNVERIFIED_CONTAM: hypothetical protein FKN15_002171 [Acipenser sinensis]
MRACSGALLTGARGSDEDAWINEVCKRHGLIYNEKRNQFEIKKNSPKELVEKVASDIEKLLAKKRKALEDNVKKPGHVIHICDLIGSHYAVFYKAIPSSVEID